MRIEDSSVKISKKAIERTYYILNKLEKNEVNMTRCDGCTKEYHGTAFPDEWVMFEVSEIGNKEDFIACSPECYFNLLESFVEKWKNNREHDVIEIHDMPYSFVKKMLEERKDDKTQLTLEDKAVLNACIAVYIGNCKKGYEFYDAKKGSTTETALAGYIEEATKLKSKLEKIGVL
jgi:hypothetical protein